MKILLNIAIAVFLPCTSVPALAQLMRLSVLPQSTVKISKDQQPVLNSIGIDYYLTEPNSANVPNQPVYNQLYSAADVMVKINNKISHRSFQSLIDGDNAVLLLQPLSKERVHAVLNPNNPDSRSIDIIELDILAPLEIGYNQTNPDVKQTMVIFRNFGSQISQQEYFQRAACLDIMLQNGKLAYDGSYALTPSSLQLLNKLYTTLDFNQFPPKDLKSLIGSSFITINDSGALTPASSSRLQQYFYYQQAIAATQAINTGWKTKNYNECKTAFYAGSYNLTRPDGSAPPIDTLINGIRYTRMIAWKGSKFAIPEEKNSYTYRRGDSVFYKSSATFFANAFFMTRAADMEQFVSSHHMGTGNIQAARTRLMQLLGLPPNATNDLFAEFWVKNTDMFRPGIDSSLNLTSILSTPDSNYMKGFLGYSTGSFSASTLFGKYPFTGLGYTWDWHPENITHVGLNEFVLKEAREIYISKTYSTEEFLRKWGN